MNKPNIRARRENDDGIGAAGPGAIPTSARRPLLRGILLPGVLALPAVVAGVFVSLCAGAAELDTDKSGGIVPPQPASSLTRPPQARVQPRAWEFAPPYGKPDLSPKNAQMVDQLYVDLMRGASPACGQAAINAPRGDRC